MDWMKLAAGGALFGVVAAGWDKIKALAWRCANLLVRRVELNTEYVHNAVISYLVAHYPRSSSYDQIFGAWYEHQRDGKYTLVPYEEFGRRTLVFWNGCKPFLFTNAQEGKKPKGEGEASSATKVYSTLTFLRGTLDVDQLIREACRRSDQLTQDDGASQEPGGHRFAIHYIPRRNQEESGQEASSNGLPWYRQSSYRLLAHDPGQLGKGRQGPGRALDQLVFPQRIKELIAEIERWRNSRQWYHDRGIPWKRGWLLYGPPGTGKTALARAFAQDLNLPIYVYNLAELSNSELMTAWREMQVNVPCLALLEDFDNVFHGRKNVARPFLAPGAFAPGSPLATDTKDGDNPAARMLAPLTFDCVLNCLDGIERADGIFTVITTNDITKIDPALGQPRRLPDGTVEFISTRPGRIDKAIELTYLEPADKKRLAKRIVGDYPEEYAALIHSINCQPDLQETPAQFQERCAQVALRCFWEASAGQRRNRPKVVGPPLAWKILWEEEERKRECLLSPG